MKKKSFLYYCVGDMVVVVCTLELRSRGLHQCYDRVIVLCFLARHSIASVYFFKPPAEQDAQKQILKMKNLGLFHLFLSAYLFP